MKHAIHELARRIPPGVTIYSWNVGIMPLLTRTRCRSPLAPPGSIWRS